MALLVILKTRRLQAGGKTRAALGCEGKWAIHPSQVELANEIFTPPAAEVEKAKRILWHCKKLQPSVRGLQHWMAV